MAGPVTGFAMRRSSGQRTAGSSASLQQSSLSRLEAPYEKSTPSKRTINTLQTPFESVAVRSANDTDASSTTDTSPLIESPDDIEPRGFPDLMSEPAMSQAEGDGMSWELRTETVRQQEEYPNPSKAAEQGAHTRQLTHYRNLLVRAQSSSSSELHELHSRLLDLENRYRQLEEEHAYCAKRAPGEDTPPVTLSKHTFTSAAASMSKEELQL
ncbi:hypothetical protein BCR39DRAFT_325074 [Naematelia encephala]|uniref:Uncharacterized protein n=1 Tax=Naematelia encephala TaxID=71784 RepID=A0A1Y2APF4_9TREE|nr:hypothetical protein BCR39DRAFT_325074 [Naematelia encephala]